MLKCEHLSKYTPEIYPRIQITKYATGFDSRGEKDWV